MTVWKKGEKYVAKFKHRGKQFVKEGFQTRSEAIQWEGKKREEVEAPIITQIDGVLLLEMMNQYLDDCNLRMRFNTVRQKRRIYRLFLAALPKECLADSVTKVDGTKFLQKFASNSKRYNRYLREIKALYNWGMEQDLIDRNPFRTIRKLGEEPYRKYVPPYEDILKVELVANQDEKDFIQTLYYLAARKGEVARLAWEDVNFEHRWVRLLTRKRKHGKLEENFQPMNDSLHEVLHARWKRRDKTSPYVFPFNQYDLRYMMDRLCEAAKVKRFGFHAIRHYVASYLNDSGKISLKQIQLVLRHKRQTTTETYLHAIERTAVDAMDFLNRKKKGRRGRILKLVGGKNTEKKEG
jgi:integrase